MIKQEGFTEFRRNPQIISTISYMSTWGLKYQQSGAGASRTGRRCFRCLQPGNHTVMIFFASHCARCFQPVKKPHAGLLSASQMSYTTDEDDISGNERMLMAQSENEKRRRTLWKHTGLTHSPSGEHNEIPDHSAVSRLLREGLEEVPLYALLFICSSNGSPCAYTDSLANDLESVSRPSAPSDATVANG